MLSGSDLLGRWQTLNSTATIPHCIEKLEESGALDNMRRLVGQSGSEYIGFQFADSDIYKVLEAIAWDADRVDPSTYEPFVSSTFDLLARVQEPDGYLNSFIQGVRPQEKLRELRWSHELYCLGHLIQAAVAWQRTTGRTELLTIAIRFADLVDRELGAGGRDDIDGHPEVETALVELFRTTGERRYLALAKRFVDLRGHGLTGPDPLGAEYFQDHEPVAEVTAATGHAVRQLYLMAGVADLALEGDDHLFDPALERIWHSVHDEKLYISGGLGSRHRGEAFGDPYELPPDRAYSETCAAIANFMWNWRMLLLSGESRFADEMERGLYNAVAVSTSVGGTEFFYSNPLQLREGHLSEEDAPTSRLSWYACACCPPNLARLMASIGSYVATADGDDLQIDLYADAAIAWVHGKTNTTVTVSTSYPWAGDINIALSEPVGDARLRLRLPAWATDYELVVDGEPTDAPVEKGYLVIERENGFSSVRLALPVKATVERPHPRIDAVRGTVAVRRGPVLYCVEEADLTDDLAVYQLAIPTHPDIVDGDVDRELQVPTLLIHDAVARTGRPDLYSPTQHTVTETPVAALKAIPYFRWANRRQGAMKVWLPTR